jgi:hypothetical protein
MHVGMEKAVAQRMAQKRLDQIGGDGPQIVTCRSERGDVVHLDTVDPLHGEHVAAGTLPVHRRHAKAGIVLRVFAKLGKSCPFEPQVHLDAGGLRQRFGNLHGAQPPA